MMAPRGAADVEMTEYQMTGMKQIKREEEEIVRTGHEGTGEGEKGRSTVTVLGVCSVVPLFSIFQGCMCVLLSGQLRF